MPIFSCRQVRYQIHGALLKNVLRHGQQLQGPLRPLRQHLCLLTTLTIVNIHPAIVLYTPPVPSCAQRCHSAIQPQVASCGCIMMIAKQIFAQSTNIRYNYGNCIVFPRVAHQTITHAETVLPRERQTLGSFPTSFRGLFLRLTYTLHQRNTLLHCVNNNSSQIRPV